MKKISVLIASLTILFGCNNQDKTSAENTPVNSDTAAMNKQDTGWISLFDGKSTAGWHSYGKTTAGELWKVADGALYLDTTKKDGYQTHGGGDLLTQDEYENYHLKLEWKIAPKGNSGIIFNIHEDTSKYKEVWFTGPEMQVVDNDGHPDGKLIKHQAGDLYDLISCSTKTVKPVGEWNKAEIMLNNGKLDLILNDVNVVSTVMWDDNWKKLVAGSKFKDMPDFGTFKKGRIALQDHGNMVWYKNIMIRKM